MSTPVSIRKVPTRLLVRCSRCLHEGIVAAFIDKVPRLQCTDCGSRSAIIVQRERTHMSARRGATGKAPPGQTLH